MYKKYEMELAGRTLSIETGKMAELANASVLVRYGDTAVMVNVTASKEPREGIDFFPLSVDYEEKLYSVGKIPGSFQKREGRPSEKAVLTSRVIDRPIRPLFPNDFRNDVVLVATALSVESDNSPEVCAMIGSSAALAISDIPFNGPTGSVAVGYVDGEIVINPTAEEREKTELNLTIAGTADKIAMIEAGANEISEDIMISAIKKGHEEIKRICEFISNIGQEIGKPKFAYTSFKINEEVYNEIAQNFKERMYRDVQSDDKEIREANMDALSQDVVAYFVEKHGEEYEKYNSSLSIGDVRAEKKAEELKQDIKDSLYKLEKKCVREMILKEKKRPDGRGLEEIRALSCEVGLFARTHGSAMFSRGQTQVMSIATLGMAKEEQRLDGLDEEESKRYMHHYNFPSYSVRRSKTIKRSRKKRNRTWSIS